MLNERTANLYVFGGQITLHDKPDSLLDGALRREMHFGHVVSEEDWFAIRDRVHGSASSPVKCMNPKDSTNGRGKLLVIDPSGNMVEINSGLPPAGHC